MQVSSDIIAASHKLDDKERNLLAAISTMQNSGLQQVLGKIEIIHIQLENLNSKVDRAENKQKEDVDKIDEHFKEIESKVDNKADKEDVKTLATDTNARLITMERAVIYGAAFVAIVTMLGAGLMFLKDIFK
jgi:predicted  nucleic acid-binding Zn-ribbon protein